MKKFFAIALSLVMTLGLLTACGGGSSKMTVEDGTLIMATNAEFPPYEYIENNEVVGIDAEIAAAIAEKLGLTLKIENMEFDSIISSVKGGKVDIGAAGMTVTPERLEEVSFTTDTDKVVLNNDTVNAELDLTSREVTGWKVCMRPS